MESILSGLVGGLLVQLFARSSSKSTSRPSSTESRRRVDGLRDSVVLSRIQAAKAAHGLAR